MAENEPQVPDVVIESLLNRVATDELKVAISGLFLTQPNKHFGGVSLQTNINEHRDERPFETNAENLLQLCKRNLIGEHGVAIKERKGLRANPDHRLERMALIGLISEWSLRWQDYSVQTVYGPMNGDPSLRRRIVGEVYDAESVRRQPVFVPDLETRLDENFAPVNTQVNKLIGFGILGKEVAASDYEIRITNADCYRPGIVAKGSPEIQGFYAALEHLGLGPTSTLRVVEVAKALIPTVDTAKLNMYLRRKLSGSRGLKGIEVLSGPVQGSKEGAIRFTAAARPAVQSLIEGVEALRQGEDLGFYAGICAQIVGDKVSFSSLLQKGAAWSPLRGRVKGFGGKERVLAALDAHPNRLDGLSIQDVRAFLADGDTKTVYAKSYLVAVLNEFVADGVLEMEVRHRDEYTKFRTNFYTPVTPRADQDPGDVS